MAMNRSDAECFARVDECRAHQVNGFAAPDFHLHDAPPSGEGHRHSIPRELGREDLDVLGLRRLPDVPCGALPVGDDTVELALGAAPLELRVPAVTLDEDHAWARSPSWTAATPKRRTNACLRGLE